MYSLFESSQFNNSPRFSYPGASALTRRWQENIERLIHHWSVSGYSVPTEHPLVSLLNGLPNPMDYGPLEYRDWVVDALPRICMGIGIAHPDNSRVVPTSAFYGRVHQEIMLSVQTAFNPHEVILDWPNLEPIQVLRYPSTAITMGLPNGSGINIESGFTVLAIDVPLLALMYWGWARTIRETPERIGQFIGQYVLPSMLWSQTNVGWFNFLNGWLNDQTSQPVINSNSIALPTNDVNLERLSLRILKDSATHMMTFTELMGCIPTLRKTRLLDHIQPPKTIMTRQNEWVLQLAYLDYVHYAYQHAEQFNGSQSLAIRNHLRRLVKRIQSDRIWDAAPIVVRPLIKADFDFTVGMALS